MRRRMTRQSHTTCSRLHSGKMLDAAEVQAQVVVRPVQAAHAAVLVKVILAAVAAMQADKVNHAVVIVPPDQTIRQGDLSRTR